LIVGQFVGGIGGNQRSDFVRRNFYRGVFFAERFADGFLAAAFLAAGFFAGFLAAGFFSGFFAGFLSANSIIHLLIRCAAQLPGRLNDLAAPAASPGATGRP